MRSIKTTEAVTPVISFILALLIVTSTIAAILATGLPAIKDGMAKAKIEDVEYQLNEVVNAIDDLPNNPKGETIVKNIAIEGGSLSVNQNEEIAILMMSYDKNYKFNVTGLDDTDNIFNLTMHQGECRDATVTFLKEGTCFLANTKILMADGTHKDIQNIKIGDKVQSYNEQSKKIVSGTVKNVFNHHLDEMTDHYLIINQDIKVTPNHRFYSKEIWVYARDLKIGDLLFSKSQNKDYHVTSIEKIYEKKPTYNFEVSQFHTYFVSIEQDNVDILVHNDESPITVTSPNGGEQWARNRSYEITWTLNGTIDNVTILCNTSFQSYHINESVNASLQSYIWDVPEDIDLGNSKIFVYDNVNTTICDSSDNNFSLVQMSLHLISPNSSDITWVRGYPANIRWNAPFVDGKVEIALWNNGVLDQIIGNTSANTGIYTWIIPIDQTPGNDYKIEISSVLHPNLQVISAESFTINASGSIEETSSYPLTGNYPIQGGLDPGSGILESQENLDGALCIELRNNSENLPFGRIWRFPLNSITYILQSESGQYRKTLQNGAIISTDPNGFSDLEKAPRFEKGENSIAFCVIQIDATNSISDISGVDEFKCKISTELIETYTREKTNIHMLSLKFYGDNQEIWMNFFNITHNFKRENDDTLVYLDEDADTVFKLVESRIDFSIDI